MLLKKVKLDDNLAELVKEVRKQRIRIPLCLSAKPDMDINELLKKIESEAYFRDDYKSLTSIFQNKPLAYEEAIKVIKIIIDSGVFEK